MTPTRPVLRYHGGKWRIAPWIISHFPRHRVYVEPFGGAASVLLRKARSYSEVYNDLDEGVVNLFRVLRDAEAAVQLVTALRLTPYARAEFDLADERCADPVEAARRLVIRSYMGHGSEGVNGKPTGFRGNVTRRGSIPAHDWMRYPDALAAVVSRLSGVVIENRPATDVIRGHDSPDTLFYVDPPYPGETRSRKRRHNYRREMVDAAAHEELAALLHSVAGTVVLSGYSCALYEDLFAGWHRAEKAAVADSAGPRTEILWINRPAAQLCLEARLEALTEHRRAEPRPAGKE